MAAICQSSRAGLRPSGGLLSLGCQKVWMGTTGTLPGHRSAQTLAQSRGIAALIMGAPGSGKGTISSKILKDFPFEHISTGDLLREHVRQNTDLGKLAKRYMDKGSFVPDEVIVDLLVDKVGSIPKGRSMLLDGFPRTTGQAEALDKVLSVDLALNLDIPRQVIIDRLTDRWIHPSSGRVYAYSYRPPKHHGKDDHTGEELIRRDDDQPEVVEARLLKYESTTSPLLEFYESRDLLHNFSGTMSDVIYKDIKSFLSGRLA